MEVSEFKLYWVRSVKLYWVNGVLSYIGLVKC